MALRDSPLLAEIIEDEILIRLPIKLVIRFRFVCKRWNSLFCDPRFFQNHFDCSTRIPQQQKDDDDDYLFFNDIHHPHSATILSRCNLSRYRINYTFSNEEYDQILLAGLINGLVCLADEKNHQFILWNPAIHWFNKISIPNTDGQTMPYLYGFGWDSSANDYKLVAKPINSVAAVVYSCKANTWNDYQVPSDLSSYEPSPSVTVRGIPYWKSTTSNQVLKFDVTTNEFKFLNDRLINYIHGKYSLINLNDRLAVVDYHFERGACVYSIDERNSSWSHIYNIDTAIYSHISMSFKYGGEIVFNGIDNLYDPKSDTIIKILGNNCCSETNCIHGISYTPSMLALEGMKPEIFKSSHKLEICDYREDDYYIDDYDYIGFDW